MRKCFTSPAPLRGKDSQSQTGFGTELGRRRSSTPSFEAASPRTLSARPSPGAKEAPQARQTGSASRSGQGAPKAQPKARPTTPRPSPSTPRTPGASSRGTPTPKGSPATPVTPVVVPRINRRDTLQRQSPATPRQRSATPRQATRARSTTPRKQRLRPHCNGRFCKLWSL